MIDHESAVFTKIATALRTAFRGIYVVGEYVPQPPSFPAVMIEEMDNAVHQHAIDTGGVERAADVMYQVDVYINLQRGKKAEAKSIIAAIDEKFAEMRFIRAFMNPVPNLNDATIYRITARYRRLITDEETF